MDNRHIKFDAYYYIIVNCIDVCFLATSHQHQCCGQRLHWHPYDITNLCPNPHTTCSGWQFSYQKYVLVDPIILWLTKLISIVHFVLLNRGQTDGRPKVIQLFPAPPKLSTLQPSFCQKKVTTAVYFLHSMYM